MNTFDQQGRTATPTDQGQTAPQAGGPRRDDLRGMSYAEGQQALSPGASVERHEAADPRLGAAIKPVDVAVAPARTDEGKPVHLKADVRDPEEPGRTNHLWFQWKQTAGPHVATTVGQFRQDLEFEAPQVRGDQQIAGEVTVTKRGHLGVQGLSTTQRFAVAVRDVGEPPPAVQQTVAAASPAQQAEPGTLPSMALLLPWLQALQAAQPQTQQRREPQPPVINAPDQTVVTSGDRAVLKAAARDPEASRTTPGSLQITWTQESGPPMADVKGQGTPDLSFKAPEGGQQVIAGKVSAIAKDGRRAEDKFSVKVQPRVAANETGRVWGDPHFVGGDGGTFDIMGKDGGVYQILNDQGIQLNAKFKKWSGTNITVVDQVGGVVTFQDAAGKLQRSEVYFESGTAKLDGQALPRGKSVKLADGGSALFLSNGDLIIDTREGYKVTLHSQGSGNRRYVDFEVQTGARGVGDGADPGGLLGQTFDADSKARNGRKGDGAQGEGAIEGVVWDYEVSGGVFGSPKPGKTAPQPLSAKQGRPLQRTTALVTANPADLGLEGFHDTGIDVSPGDEIVVKASGTAGEAGRLNRSPDGDARYTHPQKANFLCGGAPAFALVGRVAGGASFMVGSNHRSVATAGGRLLLGFNDLKGTFRDNVGEYLADVQVLKGVTAEAEAPAVPPPAAVKKPDPQVQAQQNQAALTAILGMAQSMTGGGGPQGVTSQQQVPWQPNPAARPETTTSYANPWAALLAAAAAQRPAMPVPSQSLPFLPGKATPLPTRPPVARPPWMPPQKVLARPVVETPPARTLQSGERGRLQTRVTDPDQGKMGAPRVEWRQESGPRLEKLTGQGTPSLEFTAPQTTQRVPAKGSVTAVDADGLRGEAKFSVNVEPRIAANEKGRVWGDPHFEGGDGEKYDIMGRPGGVYNILQDAGLRVTALFKRYNSNNITVMDRCGVTLTGNAPSGTKRSEVEFTPTGATVDGKALARGRMVTLADGGSAIFLGDRLVVDTREGYKLTFWPRKSGSISYVDLDVETGARGTGSDGDAEGLLGQTFDADKVAKHGKKGANAQGEGAIKGVVGDYELSGGLFGKTKDGKAAPEAAKTEQRLVRRTVLVPANPGKGASGFVDTGLEVNAGDKLLVRASGSATEAGSRLNRTPAGDARYSHPRKADFMGPAAPAFGLVARVATEPRGFHVGSSFQGAAQKKGRLELAFNDLAGTFGDNKGEYVADVQVVREVV